METQIENLKEMFNKELEGLKNSEIMIVAHGGSKNDTLCTLEYKL